MAKAEKYKTIVRTIVFNKLGEILLVKEKDGKVNLPGGKVDGKEGRKKAGQRETKEESGIKVKCTQRTFDHIPKKGKREIFYEATLKRNKQEPRPQDGEIQEAYWQKPILATQELINTPQAVLDYIMSKNK